MPKRFTDTSMWHEDWIIGLDPEYIMLWIYIKDNCDHAGIWKPNKKFIEIITKAEIDLEKAFKLFNEDKQRLIELKNGRWLLVDFFVFQYGRIMNLNNRVHRSIYELWGQNGVNLESIRGQVEVRDGVKDKDKDKEKEKEKENKEEKEVDIVIECFNKIVGTKYKTGEKSVRENIHARLCGGYTIEDCIKVIQTKKEDWEHDEKMIKFLRPSTLFRPTKFPEYLNQVRRSLKPKIQQRYDSFMEKYGNKIMGSENDQ